MGNRQVTQSNNGGEDERVVPSGGDDQVDVLRHGDMKQSCTRGASNARHALASKPDLEKSDKQKRKRFSRRSRGNEKMVNDGQTRAGVVRQASVPFLGNRYYPAYYQSVAPCYYPPGALWQQVISPWHGKAYPMPIEQRPMLVPTPYPPDAHYQHTLPLRPPRSVSLDNCHRGVEDMTVRKYRKADARPRREGGELNSEPRSRRLFKFASSGLRSNIADSLPKCEQRRGVDGQHVTLSESEESNSKSDQQNPVTNGRSKALSESTLSAPVLTANARTVMQRNARLLAEAQESGNGRNQVDGQSVVPLQRYKSLEDTCSSSSSSGGRLPSAPSRERQWPLSTNADRRDAGKLSEQNDARSTGALDTMSEIDFSWIADLESRLDHYSSEHLSRVRKSSFDTSNASLSNAGNQRDVTGFFDDQWSKEELTSRKNYEQHAQKSLGLSNGHATLTQTNGTTVSPTSSHSSKGVGEEGDRRQFVMWRPTHNKRIPVFIPEPDYE